MRLPKLCRNPISAHTYPCQGGPTPPSRPGPSGTTQVVQFYSAPVACFLSALDNQVWIEQKNGSVVRRFVGHYRYSGSVAGQTMAHLYGAVRRYVNFFQPSLKLIGKTRDGATTVKR